MKETELMVGDYVKFRCFDDSIIIGQVVEIHNEIVYLKSTFGHHWSNLKDIEPIPLTSEILEKNNFEKVLDEDGTECYRYYNSASDGYIKITLYDGGDGDWSIEVINYDKFDDNEIVYKNDFIFLKVHQLQHALKLCGIEKEIVL